jgi:hypothetical protein
MGSKNPANAPVPARQATEGNFKRLNSKQHLRHALHAAHALHQLRRWSRKSEQGKKRNLP